MLSSVAFLLNLWKLIYHLMEYMSVWYDNFVDRRNFGVYISAAKYKIKIKNSDITGLPMKAPLYSGKYKIREISPK
jgi:hypothetical protein